MSFIEQSKIKKEVYFHLAASAILLLLGVSLGAFAAHALRRFTPLELIESFKTGVHYQIVHSLGIALLTTLTILFDNNEKDSLALVWIRRARKFMYLGIGIFSLNLYLYVLSMNKIFVYPVPLGGFSFILAWGMLAWPCILLYWKTHQSNLN